MLPVVMNQIFIIILVGNALLVLAVNRIGVFAGPSTPDVVSGVILGFGATNLLAVTWMVLFLKLKFQKTSLIGGAFAYIMVFSVLCYLSMTR